MNDSAASRRGRGAGQVDPVRPGWIQGMAPGGQVTAGGGLHTTGPVLGSFKQPCNGVGTLHKQRQECLKTQKEKVHDGAKPKRLGAKACHASQNMLYLLVFNNPKLFWLQFASPCWPAALLNHSFKTHQADCCRQSGRLIETMPWPTESLVTSI